jgi:hypothetical protein
MKVEINLEPEQISALIRTELSQAYEDVAPDKEYQLMAAIATVLEFYMSPSQFQEWEDGVFSKEE